MRKPHIPEFLFILLIGIMLSSGCATFRKKESLRSYNELRNISFGQVLTEAPSQEKFTLTDESTLSDYLAYAALNNPGLQAAFNRWKAALEKIPQVQSLPDPHFTYSYFIEEIETRVGPQRHKFDLSQSFPWFGKLNLLGEVALRDASIQKQKYEELKLKLFYEVTAAYSEYYYLFRAHAVMEENLKLLSYFEQVARTKYTTGETPHAAVIKAQVELGKLEERVLSLDDLKIPIIARLNTALNRPSDAPLPEPKTLPEEDITFTNEQVIAWLKEYNPQLKALDFQAKKESAMIKLAKKQYYPDFTIGVNYIETGTALMPGTVDSGKDPIIGMFSVNIPLWRKKYGAAVQEATIRYNAVEKDRKNRENKLIAEIQTALYKFRDSVRKIELYRDALIPKARQSLTVTQRAFEAGTVDFLNLIDAQRTMLEFELAFEQALSDRTRNHANIELLAGRDIDKTD